MSDEKSQEPGGGRLLPKVQWVDNAAADVICPLCHQRMVKTGGKAHGFPADPENGEYIRGGTAIAFCQTCEVTQQWSFTRGAGPVQFSKNDFRDKAEWKEGGIPNIPGYVKVE